MLWRINWLFFLILFLTDFYLSTQTLSSMDHTHCLTPTPHNLSQTHHTCYGLACIFPKNSFFHPKLLTYLFPSLLTSFTMWSHHLPPFLPFFCLNRIIAIPRAEIYRSQVAQAPDFWFWLLLIPPRLCNVTKPKHHWLSLNYCLLKSNDGWPRISYMCTCTVYVSTDARLIAIAHTHAGTQ